MLKISKSPDRMTFQQESSKQKLEDPTSTEEQRANAQAYLDMWAKWRVEAETQEITPKWQKDNMEYDLRTCEPMLNKVRSSDTYAQNLYAAMCNRQFQKLEVVPVLKDERWSCSWRHAGGIIADMREEGDYIDWYCSGIGDGLGNGDVTGVKGYVSESVVTDEIREDLKQLGWIVLDIEDDDRD
jgi:hypothetical protein